jgi:hypothetical protein
MSGRDDDFAGLLVAGAIVGVGAALLGAAYVYQTNEERRHAFVQRLADLLESANLSVVAATFGRGPANRPFWNVTLHTPYDGVRVVRVDLAADTEPYGPETCEIVADRVAAVAA